MEATAGIPEYWIVDPRTSSIVVLELAEDSRYEVAGSYERGQDATSVPLDGFAVSVDKTFDAAQA